MKKVILDEASIRGEILKIQSCIKDCLDEQVKFKKEYEEKMVVSKQSLAYFKGCLASSKKRLKKAVKNV